MKSFIFKKIKNLLYPLSFITKSILLLRHFLYDKGLIKSRKFTNVSVIVIGNLSFGGTGKTPMTLFLVERLSAHIKVAVLSRGYGRKSKGFCWVHTHSDFSQVGDEPLLIKRRMPGIPVAVCERRVKGIAGIVSKYPDIDVVVLDDAFQHRSLRPHCAILLTTFDCPFTSDYLFPTGSLRDLRARASAADAIVVTKTPSSVRPEQMSTLKASISEYSSAEVYFSTYVNEVYAPESEQTICLKGVHTVVVSTIANPKYLIEYLKNQNAIIEKTHIFRDHYPISNHMWETILSECKNNNWLCVITEKEFVKLSDSLVQQFSEILRIISIKFEIENKNVFFELINSKLIK